MDINETLKKLSTGHGSKVSAPQARSQVNAGLVAIKNWDSEDRAFFLAVFSGPKSAHDIAAQFGLNQSQYAIRKRHVIRKFMHGSGLLGCAFTNPTNKN